MRNRLGLGFDVHPFGDVPPLVLGGVHIADASRLVGHSDGDAVCHAVADALLGPVGLPDLGTLFPASDESLRDADSLAMLGEVVSKVAAVGWWVDNVDIVIAAETPRLAPYMSDMAANLTAVLAPAKEPMGPGIHVSVRPKRAEGLGAIGRAEGIAVWAVALLSRWIARRKVPGPGAPGSVASQRAPDLRHRRSRQVDLVPRVAGHVSMYVCGPTPYDVPHLGHGRKEVVFDTIRRYLLWSGLEVTYVSNVTDVDDNIIARAEREGTSEPELSTKYEQEFWRQFDRLNIKRPDEMPRATEWIDEMQDMIAKLVASGHAYVIEGEGVYFQVDSLPEYGGLSHRTVDELIESAGARVDVDARKRSPVDFALWKASKPGEPSWDSPWGRGRPGWHIECTAMSLKILGDGFDLHGGGNDLVFPHHENELAQAIAAGHEFARHWLHNAMLNVNGEKMSKSLGNFTTLADVLDRYDPRAFRILVLKTHYRRQMEIGAKELSDAQKDVESFDALVRRAVRPAFRTSRREAPRSFATRWTTTSTRRPRWPCCRRFATTRTARSTTGVPPTRPHWSRPFVRSRACSASNFPTRRWRSTATSPSS